MAQERKIEELLAPYGAFITYVALKSEVPFLDYLTLTPEAVLFEIAPRASLNPKEEAVKAMAAIGDKPAAILIPGKKFDAAGTRYGQGGGWYDRFLAEVPRAWYRVGFCYASQFSDEPLLREPWDQEMDAVCIIKNDGSVAVVLSKK